MLSSTKLDPRMTRGGGRLKVNPVGGGGTWEISQTQISRCRKTIDFFTASCAHLVASEKSLRSYTGEGGVARN